ncbi:conserved hypothetical protein [Neospora caninum Liverpool]|uniref:Transmembrane protein n=1 Tax=Neospora caninum (strain Liverpool) TaxID=572307 RepID=F0VGW3_NEOCL|nr:conserved hypothetical protein [Neospora caninum Liverpool]CBZ52957.1 conserved hypothetical protein [Neospora caninum Liverpool]CEL66942.1 TPA: hypothetical protein BN1204_027460 [Neospora caninum Liverpool]|eukprot:XP_003882989.1 conserved hypothetical protein [Neospora caninum Liverpool]
MQLTSKSAAAGLLVALFCVSAPGRQTSFSLEASELARDARPLFSLPALTAAQAATLVRRTRTAEAPAATPEDDGNDEDEVPLKLEKRRTFRSLSLPNHRRNKKIMQIAQWAGLGLAVLTLVGALGYAVRPEKQAENLEVAKVTNTSEKRRQTQKSQAKGEPARQEPGVFGRFERKFISKVKSPALRVRRTLDEAADKTDLGAPMA